MDQSDVEESISTELTAQFGEEPDSIDCPGDLEGEVGTTTECTPAEGEDTLGVTVTVTVNGVDGEQVGSSAQVDDEVQ